MQGMEDGLKRGTVLRHGILDLRGNLRENHALDDPLFLQFAQMSGEHFLGDAGHSLLQLAEPQRMVMKQVKHDRDLPFAYNRLQRRRDFAIVRSFVHGAPLAYPSYIEVTLLHSGAYFIIPV